MRFGGGGEERKWQVDCLEYHPKLLTALLLETPPALALALAHSLYHSLSLSLSLSLYHSLSALLFCSVLCWAVESLLVEAKVAWQVSTVNSQQSTDRRCSSLTTPTQA